MRCPIKGHDHDLVVVHRHVQMGSGTPAEMLECPGGNYRWFVINGRFCNDMRFKKPRYGWAKREGHIQTGNCPCLSNPTVGH